MNALETLSKRFRGKRVLITGPTSGLGEAPAPEDQSRIGGLDVS